MRPLCAFAMTFWLSLASAQALPEATLLLGIRGLEEPHKTIVYNQLELEFMRQWDQQFATKVVRDASYLDLYKTLQNPAQRVIFWVSHAGTFQAPAGLSSGAVTDAYGDDVKHLFKLLPENLYWLGLVGCKAEPILRSYEEQGYYQHHSPRFVSSSFAYAFPFGINVLHSRLKNHDGVIIDSSKNIVDAFRGLRASMSGAKWLTVNVSEPPQNSCQTGPYLGIEGRRTSDRAVRDFAAVSVESREFPLTVLDAKDPYSRYPMLLPLSELQGSGDITLVVQGREGFDPRDEFQELGRFEFWAPQWNLRWERVEVGGRPLGQTQHVYRLDEPSKKALERLQAEPIYWPKSCY